MKVLIVPNMTKENSESCTAMAAAKLLSIGCEALLDKRFAPYFGGAGARFGEFSDLISECDIILAVGGDGTMLHAAKHGLHLGKPVLGVNAGRLGFLALAEQNELGHLLERLACGDYYIEDRTILKVESTGIAEAYAINDAVLTKSPDVNIADFEVFCEHRLMDSFRADGIIFATPTGSTAYSLSAGGPIIDPLIDAVVMTPICPHTLTARPTIFSGHHNIIVKAKGPLCLSVDGEPSFYVKSGCKVIISKAKITAKFINFGEKAFFEILSEKMRYRG